MKRSLSRRVGGKLVAGTAALTLSMAVLVSGSIAVLSDKAVAINSATVNARVHETSLASLLPAENGGGCVSDGEKNCVDGVQVWPRFVAPKSNVSLGAKCGSGNSNSFWVLGSTGAVQQIENGKTVASFDIPDGEYRWTTGGEPPATNKGVEGQYWVRQINRDTAQTGGSYNGFGITNDSAFVLETGSNPDSSTYSENVLIHQFDIEKKQWYQLDRNGRVSNSWKTGNADGKAFSFDTSPDGIPKTRMGYTGTTVGNSQNFTFKNAYANFEMGDARQDGVYVMGGYTAPAINGQVRIKLFARKTDGTIVYLGYALLDVKRSGSIALNGDLQFDTEGNMQLLFSEKQGTNSRQGSEAGSPRISAYTISAEDLNSALESPSAVWNGDSWRSGSRKVSLKENNNQGPAATNLFTMTQMFPEVELKELGSISTGAIDAATFGPDGTVNIAYTVTAFDGSGTGSGAQTSVIYHIDPATGKVINNDSAPVVSNQVGKKLPALYDSSQNRGTVSAPGQPGILVDGGVPLGNIVDMAGCPTYKPIKHDFEVKKVDPHNNLDSVEDDVVLPGAKFKLYKDDGVLTDGELTWDENKDTKLHVDQDGNIVEPSVAGASDELTTQGDGTATWRGLENGNYWLRETQPPANYIGISEPILVKITDESEKIVKRTVNNTPSSLFQCKAGDIYSLTERGWLQKVGPNGSVTAVGSRMGLDFVSAQQNYRVANALGISASGHKAYAIERNASWSVYSDVIYVWEYDAKSAKWSRQARWDTRDKSEVNGTGASVVAGAVDPETGHYAFGGFYKDGDFFIWDYDPVERKITKKGKIVTKDTEKDVNGDMAFDSQGNLMVSRGAVDPGNSNNGQIVIYSITADNYKEADPATPIPTSETFSFVTEGLTNVNGVTFDSTGKAFLSNVDQLASFDMPNWKNKTVVTSDLSNVSHQEPYWYQAYNGRWYKGTNTIPHGDSTDLASCSYPPTITVKKNLPHGRVAESDQFKLTLKQGDTPIAEMETRGSVPGIQDQQIGPFPTVGEAELTIEENGIGNTNLEHYAAGVTCDADNSGTYFVEDKEVPATITIPKGAKSVTCTVTNDAIQGSLQFEKHGYSGKSQPDASALTDDSLLGDSEWKLASKDGKKSWSITDCQAEGCAPATAGEPYDSDPAKGKFNITELAKGDYILTETKAPAGFAVGTDGPFKFTIGPASQNAILIDKSDNQLPKRNGVQIIFNVQRNAPDLPLSGGLGRDYFLIAGGAVLAAGAAVVLLLGRKRSIVRDLG